MAKFIAHRGFSHKKKQNTLDAFQLASESDAYGVETDVRITKDGVFIAFHDKSMARLSGRYKIIEETDFKTVQKLKIFDRERRHIVPTFVEFLNNCKMSSKAAVVEIKSDLTDKQTDKLIQTIVDENYLPNTIFLSFNTRVLKYIRAYSKSFNENSSKSENSHLQGIMELFLTIFPKPTRFVQPAKSTLNHPSLR